MLFINVGSKLKVERKGGGGETNNSCCLSQCLFSYVYICMICIIITFQNNESAKLKMSLQS